MVVDAKKKKKGVIYPYRHQLVFKLRWSKLGPRIGIKFEVMVSSWGGTMLLLNLGIGHLKDGGKIS